jgi:hypothetical protein
MDGYLEYNGREKGYKTFSVSKESILANIGKRIVYVTNRDVDLNRGYVFPRYGIICGIRYSTVYLNDYGLDFDKRDLLECGIEIDKTETPTV